MLRALSAALLLTVSSATLAQVGSDPFVPAGGSGGAWAVNISTICGVGGGPITGAGTITGYWPVNAQTGTTYSTLATDCGNLVTLANASAIAVTLDNTKYSANTGFNAKVLASSTGSATFTPSSGTVDGAASFVLAPGQSTTFTFDGANWTTGGRFAVGPASSAANHLAVFADTTGQRLSDGGAIPTGGIAGAGYVSSFHYTLHPVTGTGASTGLAAGSIYCSPFTTLQASGLTTFGVTGLDVRITTLSTGNSSAALEGMIYANDTAPLNRPGAVVGGTGNFVTWATGTAATVSANFGSPITLSYATQYWLCVQPFDTTVQFAAISNAGGFMIQNQIGSSALSPTLTNPVSGVSVTGTFGTWPATLHGASFTEITTVAKSPLGAIIAQ